MLISGESFGTFRNCSFENFQLPRELFDVSFGGMLQLDTCGFGEGILTLRLAEFPGGRPREDLSVHGEVVKIGSAA